MFFHRQPQGKPNEHDVNSPYQEENHLTDQVFINFISWQMNGW
jgi:hypothetical protein